MLPTGIAANGKKARKSRGRGLRTNTGCTICRRRHMKCDETKPICGACAKSNRTCAYGSLPTGSPGEDSSSRTVTTDPANIGPEDQRPGSHTRFSPIPQQDDPGQHSMTSPESHFSGSTSYGTDLAPLRWLDLLAGDVANNAPDLSSLEALGSVAMAQRQRIHDAATQSLAPTIEQGDAGSSRPVSLQSPHALINIPPVPMTPFSGSNISTDEHRYWQEWEPENLNGQELDVFHRYVTGIALWIDLFDPLRHFSTFVPQLALHNTGVMKSLLALGARHLSIKPPHTVDAANAGNAAVQYYYETLQYLQSAMRYTTYKNSPELLATTVIVSTYEMLDGAGKEWERHLKGVFWIQRSREINGESGGFEGAVWWAWLRQDVWAAFREHRRCFSFFRPTKQYHAMDMWDMASRVVYILAQAVNYSSKEEKEAGEADLSARILRAAALLNLLDEWRQNLSVQFNPLSVESHLDQVFKPIWIHPSALGTSLQMHCMARILLLVNQPAAGGYQEYQAREHTISECVDMIGGIAMRLSDDASRLMSTQCLFAAGLYCSNPTKQNCIIELIREHTAQTGWPANCDLADELHAVWARKQPG